MSRPVVIQKGQHRDFENELWRWFGSLDGDDARLEQLRACCEEHCLDVILGTDELDVFCRLNPEAKNATHNAVHIAYGMFCMLQFQLDKENAEMEKAHA